MHGTDRQRTTANDSIAQPSLPLTSVCSVDFLAKMTAIMYCYLGNTMDAMAMKRTSLHLDDRDLKTVERLAKQETQCTGSRVSASQIVRRLIREFLHRQKKGK